MVKGLTGEDLPALLVSYHYLDQWLRIEGRCSFRDYVLDSGAFSANSLGININLDAYVETARHLLATDKKLTEVFALDVIGDSRASQRNAETMRERGVVAIPCYHVGDPPELLTYYARNYPKIALGGAVGYRKKLAWARLCFKAVWPCKIHGFGFGTPSDILALPWHSVDATNWEIGPCAFGTWQGLGPRRYKMSVRGGQQNLRSEVEHYLRLERQMRTRWAKRYQELESL